MDAEAKQRSFELLIGLREELRHRACLPGMAGRWHVVKAQKILIASEPDRLSLVAESTKEDAWPDYIAGLPSLITLIEEQDQVCAEIWSECRLDEDQSQFLAERAHLIELFEQLHVRDRAYERIVRQDEKPLLARAIRMLNTPRSSDRERYELDNALRMTPRDFVENEQAIQTTLAKLDDVRLGVVYAYERWATEVAESMYPGSRVAKEGALKALHRAVGYYDYRRGYDFETYTRHWLEEYMLRALVNPK